MTETYPEKRLLGYDNVAAGALNVNGLITDVAVDWADAALATGSIEQPWDFSPAPGKARLSSPTLFNPLPRWFGKADQMPPPEFDGNVIVRSTISPGLTSAASSISRQELSFSQRTRTARGPGDWFSKTSVSGGAVMSRETPPTDTI